MRLDADRLATDHLRLELPAGDDARPPNELVLGPSLGVTGTYLHDATRFALQAIRGERLGLQRVAWALPKGRVVIEGPTALEGAFVNGEIPREAPHFVGTISAERSEPARGELRWGDLQLGAEIELQGFKLSPAGTGGTLVSVDKLTLRDLSLTLPQGTLTAKEVTLRKVQLWFVGARFSLECRSLELAEAELALGETHMAIEHATLPAGARVLENSLEIPELRLDRATLAMAVPGPAERQEAEAQSSRAETQAETSPAEEGRGKDEQDRRRGSAPFDLSFLDGLQGHMDADLNVDAHVPVIGRRRKTHHFRIPIQDGTLNYKQLERDLATLEDAFIDLKVRDGKLSLELDIPLVPFFHRSLVLFRLAPEDIERARKQRRIRLRSLAEWELPQRDAERGERRREGRKKDAPSVQLQALDLEHIDLSLGLTSHGELELAGALLRLGDGEHPPLGSLRVSGALRHHPSAPAAGALRASIAGICLGIEGAALGPRRLSFETLELDAIDPARLDFKGLRPTRASCTLQGAIVKRLSYTSIA